MILRRRGRRLCGDRRRRGLRCGGGRRRGRRRAGGRAVPGRPAAPGAGCRARPDAGPAWAEPRRGRRLQRPPARLRFGAAVAGDCRRLAGGATALADRAELLVAVLGEPVDASSASENSEVATLRTSSISRTRSAHTASVSESSWRSLRLASSVIATALAAASATHRSASTRARRVISAACSWATRRIALVSSPTRAISASIADDGGTTAGPTAWPPSGRSRARARRCSRRRRRGRSRAGRSGTACAGAPAAEPCRPPRSAGRTSSYGSQSGVVGLGPVEAVEAASEPVAQVGEERAGRPALGRLVVGHAGSVSGSLEVAHP